MAQTISIDTKVMQRLINDIETLQKEMAEIKAGLLNREPAYGSDSWWEWSEKKAKQDIKAGRYTVVHDAKTLQAHLNALK
jgi:flagellar biosynthesis component FlhA